MASLSLSLVTSMVRHCGTIEPRCFQPVFTRTRLFNITRTFHIGNAPIYCQIRHFKFIQLITRTFFKGQENWISWEHIQHYGLHIENTDLSYSLLPRDPLNVAVEAQADWFQVVIVRVSGMMPADVKGSKGLSRSSPMTIPLMGRVHSHLHPPGPSGHCETRLGYRDRGTYSRRAGRVTVTTHCKHSEKSKNK
jgi:hypothetical protein